jgi:hypothetical protein
VRVERKPRTPQVRCHECGAVKLAALCHHCWRPLCSEHAHPSGRARQWLVGREGSGTGLGRTRARHCVTCSAPVPRGLRMATAALAVLAAGGAVTLILIVGSAAAWAVTAVVIALAGLVPVAARRQARRVWHRRPMPVRPTLERLGLTERLNVAITLDEQGHYVTTPTEVNGRIEALLVLGPTDRDRFDRRLRRSPRGAARDTRFTAGRLVLKGYAPISASDGALAPVIPLDGSTADFAVFQELDAQSASRWPYGLNYKLLADPDLNAGPIWITPAVLPGSDRRALELELQWVKLGPDKKPLSMEIVDFLELLYPVGWGEVEQVIPRGATAGLADTDAEGRSWRRVRWTQILPKVNEQEERRLRLVVRLENRIDLNEQVSGSVEVVMKGALSGIENIEFYGSLGERRRQSSGARIRTRIRAGFDLSLASIRYQEERVFPRHHARNGEADDVAASFDVIPNDETVIDLTNAMSKSGYYVKRVIENPPRSGNKADVVQRYWDIAGRYYHGLWPLDFHLIVTGEEFHRGDIRPERGTTNVRIIVRGSHSNPAMEKRIEEFWKDLNELTCETIQARLPKSCPPSENGSVREGQGTTTESAGCARPAHNGPVLQVYLRKLIASWVNDQISDQEFWETRRRADQDCGLPDDPGPDPDDEAGSDDED